MWIFILINVVLVTLSKSTILFQENFLDESYTEHWIESTHRGIDQGKFQLGVGKYFGDYWSQLGLQTSQNNKYYGISTKFDAPFSSHDQDLIIQYQVKLTEPIECGGGYLKVLGNNFDPKLFKGDTPYKIMFGPDICGEEKKIVQVILEYKGKYFSIKRNIKCRTDQFSHLYTLIIRSNNTYSVLIDNIKESSGDLEDDFEFLQPRMIKDPNVSQPLDWDDRERIDDPNDVKPDDWDQPMKMNDPSAKKPINWDDETEGEWEPPLIDNPSYKGDWRPKKIINPNYKGVWEHPRINNPDYVPDPNLYVKENIGGIGFDIWQVVSGSIFDNILITNNAEEAYEIGESMWREAYNDELHAVNTEKEREEKHREELKQLDEEKRRKEQEELEEEQEDEILNDKPDQKQEL